MIQQVYENIMARRSVRKYTDEPVDRAELDAILECGLHAPNGHNRQCYEVKVVCDPDSCAFLSENLVGLYRAPVYLFLAAGDEYDGSTIDVGLFAENICLASAACGLGSINLLQPLRDLLTKPDILAKLGFSVGYRPALILALGHPAAIPSPRPRTKDKITFVKF